MDGVLERTVYFNDENNFTVAKLQVAKSRDLVAIVGNMPCPNPGEALRLKGCPSTQGWVSNVGHLSCSWCFLSASLS